MAVQCCHVSYHEAHEVRLRSRSLQAPRCGREETQPARQAMRSSHSTTAAGNRLRSQSFSSNELGFDSMRPCQHVDNDVRTLRAIRPLPLVRTKKPPTERWASCCSACLSARRVMGMGEKQGGERRNTRIKSSEGRASKGR
jgi:hypothetical protein